MQQNERVAICAVAGMGGVGKTELALQYAGEQWKQGTYPGGVCWLQGRDRDVGTQIVEFAIEQFQLSESQLNHLENLPDLSARVRWCWQYWLPGNVLLVLDDVTDYKQVKHYLPSDTSRFKVLITTRSQLGASIWQLSLDVLKPRAALALLESLIDRERLKKEPWVARKLCRWLGYLPLGLELVGRYLRRKPHLSLEEMLSRLQAKRLEQLALKKPKSEDDMTADWGVRDAFELSWQELDHSAQQLGFCLSLFALAPIPWQLAERCLPDSDPEELEETRDYSLVYLHLVQPKGRQTYQLHQLIREFFIAKREESGIADELKREFCRVVVAEAMEIPEKPTLEQIKAVTPVIPHLAEAATTQQDWLRDDNLILPFVGLGHFYQGQGIYNQAKLWREDCVVVTRQRLGENHPDVATSLNNLAGLHYSQGRYDKAEPLYQKALGLRKRLLGENHPDVATSLNNLALLYYSQGYYDQAEPLYLETLALYKRRLGKNHPNVATSLNNLALLYYSQRHYDQAEPLYQEALALRKRLLGENHPDVATSLNNLAGLYYSQGRYDQAEPLLIKALALRKRLLGENHPDVATSLNNLAGLYYSQKRYNQAEPLLIEALSLYKRLLGENHSNVPSSLNNLAGLYKSQGRYNQAEPLYQEAVAIAERTLGINHPSSVIFRKNLQILRTQTSSSQLP